MEKKLLFVINPYAGKSEIRQRLVDILELFVGAGYLVTVHITSKSQELPQYVAEHAQHYDLVVCSGGDGTFNETVSGLMSCKNRPLLGYIPAGTVNDFASGVGIPKNLLQAAQVVVQGEPRVCDIGSFNERYFTYIAAFGAFTEVSYQTPQPFKNVLGRVAYLMEGIKRIPEIKSYHLTAIHEHGKVEGDFLFGMVSNSTSVGGFKLNGERDVSMSDGLMEVTLVRSPKYMLDMHRIVNSMLAQNPDPDCIVSFKAATVVFDSQESLPWTLDGEYGGMVDHAVIRNRKHALRVLVERDEKSSGSLQLQP